MSEAWPMVTLGEVLNYRKEFIEINDLGIYKRCRVQLHAQGIVLRDTVSGAEIKTKKQQVCKAGDLLVAEIDAKVGGFGIVPDELESAIVSSHYFLFQIKEALLNKSFLNYYIRTPYFREQVAAQGSTNYAALRPRDVLGYKIPLPPLSEQKRITARIEELSAKVEEARGLRRQAVEEAETMLNSASNMQFSLLYKGDVPKQNIALFSMILRGRGPVYQEGSGKSVINQKCVRWDGVDLVYAKEVSNEWFQSIPPHYFLQKDDILVNSTGEGTIGRACLATPNAIGYTFDSHVLVIRPQTDKTISTFVTHYLHSPIGQAAINESKGAKTTKQTELGTTKLGAILLPVPPLSEQRRIVAYLDGLQAKVDALKRLQAETSAELDAMLPSVLDKAFRGGEHFYKELSSRTTLERSTDISVAELAAIAYPATDADKTICAAALAVVEQSGGLSSLEHLDALLLATHPDWCKKFLNQQDQRALDTAIHSAPRAFFVGQDQSIRWKECRDYLEELSAITVAHRANDQPVHAGPAMASIKASLPTGTDEVVKYALIALDRVNKLHKNMGSVPKAQRSILDAFSAQRRQYKLTA